ncbi:MAG: hypothetical protein Q8935_00065 [Bacillota bacterium]|nr:hypothetical protein [Bacillota bacterium]
MSIAVYDGSKNELNKVLTRRDSGAIFVEDDYFEQKDIPDMSMGCNVASD